LLLVVLLGVLLHLEQPPAGLVQRSDAAQRRRTAAQSRLLLLSKSAGHALGPRHDSGDGSLQRRPDLRRLDVLLLQLLLFFPLLSLLFQLLLDLVDLLGEEMVVLDLELAISYMSPSTFRA
jgi:hypothetical protein